MSRCRHLFGPFPFVVPHISGGSYPNSEYPIGVPLATAMRWYWRIQKWRAEFSWAGGSTDEYQLDGLTFLGADLLRGYASSQSFYMGRAAMVPNSPVAALADEWELELPSIVEVDSVTGPDFVQAADVHTTTVGSDFPDYDSNAVLEGAITCNMFDIRPQYVDDTSGATINPLGLVYNAVTDLYYPRIRLGLYSHCRAVGLIAGNSYLGPGYTLHELSLSVTFDGYTFDLPGSIVTSGNRLGGSTFVGTHTAALTVAPDPYGYWEHRGQNSIPTWNTDGTAATNPVTGVPFTLDERLALPCP